jgi:hypothetical protein
VNVDDEGFRARDAVISPRSSADWHEDERFDVTDSYQWGYVTA